MSIRRQHVRSLHALAACALLATGAVQAQQLPPETLLARGYAAYDKLPAVPTLKDARTFADAVRYLFAYEQRIYRRDPNEKLAADAARDLAWMLERLDAFKTGKGDSPVRLRDDDTLRRQGVTLYKTVKTSESDGMVWDVSGFISATAELYGYLQCSPSPESDAMAAYAWLSDPERRLVQSGTKGDENRVDPGSWLGKTPRPGAPDLSKIAATRDTLHAAGDPKAAIPQDPIAGAAARAVDSTKKSKASKARMPKP